VTLYEPREPAHTGGACARNHTRFASHRLGRRLPCSRRIGGFLGRLLFGSGDSLVQPSSWIGSSIALVVYDMIKRRFQSTKTVA
jgi:hypothetical protein